MESLTSYLVKNAVLVNEGEEYSADVLLQNGYFEKIASEISNVQGNFEEINAEGKYLIPGIIDNHVHFREPGLTHKGNIYTESRAAVAGGVTSFMEMPNTIPQTINLENLEDKFQRAGKSALANYSFYLGTTNDNLETIKQANDEDICGIKIFMGSSTGNMLVDDPAILEDIFGESSHLIAIHAEDETVIAENFKKIKEKYGKEIPLKAHPEIRDEKGCYEASRKAIQLAQKKQARLHILHLTTSDEIPLFTKEQDPSNKLITTEACVHHLYFSSDDYEEFGNKLKCFPAIKDAHHKKALLQGLLEGSIDQIASDHAPHTLEEKQKSYLNAPGGIPMVQHNLPVMLEFYRENKISLSTIVEKMCHNVALTYGVKERGFLREGYKADCVLLDLENNQTVNSSNIFYKCGWSPFEGHTFPSAITDTWVNGNHVYSEGWFISENPVGERLSFRRK